MNTPEQSSFFSRKSLLLLFIFISSFITIISIAYILNYRKSFQEDTANQLTTIADLKIREIVDWRNARLGDASLFYKNRNFSELVLRSLRNPLDRKSRSFLLSWMAKVNSAYKYNRLEIYDAGFNLRLAYPEGIGREENFFLKDDENELRSGKIVFKDFYRDEHDQKIYMMLLVPLYNELSHGEFIGTLAMRIDPKVHLYPFINQWPVPAESAEALLARREGDYAVYLNELRFREGAPLDLRVPLTAAEFAVTKGALNQEGVAEALDYKGEKVIAAIKRIPDTPWFIVAHISESEVTAPFVGRLWTIIIIALLLIVSAGIIIVLFRKHYDTQIYQKRLQDAELLAASEERFRKLHESMIDAFVQVDMDGEIVSCNSAFMEITGYTFEELKGLSYIDLTPEKWHRYEAEIIESQILKKGFSDIFEKEYCRKDATLIPVELRTSLLTDSAGKPLGMWAIVRDITDRKRNLEYLEKFNLELEKRVSERTSALEKVNSELDSFTFSISHDLRAPLRHITGFIDMLRREVGEIHNEKVRHFMDVIDKAAKRMADLIDDLLSFSRLGRTPLSVKSVNMEILLDDVMSDFTDEIARGNVSIIRHPLPDVTGDRSMLRVVLVNLISNAIKFSSKESKPIVEIGCEKGESGDICYIHDNGAGFNMHYAERLFGVFQRFHNEKDFPGTGIGLAIVRSIIERHNGKIRAESEPGMGASFYFTIPVHEQRSDKPGGVDGKQQ